MAAELNLPLIVHNRETHEDVLAVLDGNLAPGQRVIMHCFAGGQSFAEQCLQRGFHLGLAGPLTYPKSFALKKVAASAPLEQLLIETDCPWLPPQSRRGKRNEPAYVTEVAQQVARVRGMSIEDVAAITTENAVRAFGLSV